MADTAIPAKVLQDFPYAEMDKTTRRIMLHTIIALMIPVSVGAYLWGISMARALVICVGSSVLTEFVLNKIQGKRNTLGDYTAVITGMVIALNMRPGLGSYPLLLTGIVGIGVGKMMFGGAGYNIINPAVIGRLLPVAGFPGLWATSLRPTIPTLMQYGGLTWWEANLYVFVRDIKSLPFYAEKIKPLYVTSPYYDILSGTSYLETVKSWYKSGAMPEGMVSPTQYMGYWELFSGINLPGVMGESAKWAILLGLLYMVIMKVIKPGVPVMIWIMAMVFGWIFAGVRVGPEGYGPMGFFAGDPLHWLLVGGILLGSVYMETDPITSPISNLGKVVYALFFTFVVGSIRLFFSFPEGVSFGLISSNLVLPFILIWTDPNSPKAGFYRRIIYSVFAAMALSVGLIAVYQYNKNKEFLASVKGISPAYAQAEIKKDTLVHYTLSQNGSGIGDVYLVAVNLNSEQQITAMVSVAQGKINGFKITGGPKDELAKLDISPARFVGKGFEEITDTDPVALCAQKALKLAPRS